MGLMDRVNQAKCKTGIHAGDWQWVAPGNCGQVRTCTRCGNVGTRAQHDVTSWASAGDPAQPCLMERHCQRCLGGETKVEHLLEFKYQQDINMENAKNSVAGAAFAVFAGVLDGGVRCRGQHVCARCGYTDGHFSEQHVWSDMYQPNGGGTRYQRDCLRCGRVDKSMI
ncbi:MAG TPA: hypothetical protein VHZ03_32045 [Trebonia sp.]|jgi:hypothetical protein|nr:hypothetical protein [Trebonia sp.]